MNKMSEIEITEEIKEKVTNCTSREELDKLAREYDVELTAEEISDILKKNTLKELSDEDLDKVAGGQTSESKTCMHLPPEHRGRYIGQYESEAYVGKKVYLVQDNYPDEYFWGTLTRSWEDDILKDMWGHTDRAYDMQVEGVSCPGILAERVLHDSDRLIEVGQWAYRIRAYCVTMYEYIDRK